MKVVKKDFWIPCNFETRKPYLLDQLLFIPDFYKNHQEFFFPPWCEIFEKDLPVYVEYCSGNGEWIFQKAFENPHVNWVAVEKDLSRARNIWLKVKKHRLKNLFVVFGDAIEFTKFYLKKESIDQVYINFPDPWPKKRHEKKRLIQCEFVEELFKRMKKHTKAILVTDNFDYSSQIIEIFSSNINWKSSFPPPFYVHDWPKYGASFFRDLWLKKGEKIFFHQFVRL